MLLVRPARFERATYGLEGRCSILLSYGRVKTYKILKAFLARETVICNSICRGWRNMACCFATGFLLVHFRVGQAHQLID